MQSEHRPSVLKEETNSSAVPPIQLLPDLTKFEEQQLSSSLQMVFSTDEQHSLVHMTAAGIDVSPDMIGHANLIAKDRIRHLESIITDSSGIAM